MAVLTRSSSARREPNAEARWSVAVALLALAVPPAAFVAARMIGPLTLVQATFAGPAGALLGVSAIVLARRARRRTERTLGRVGEERVARVGKALGYLATWLGLTVGLALAFYGLLLLFD